MSSDMEDLTVEDAWNYIDAAAVTAWHKTTKRIRGRTAILIVCFLSVLLLLSPAATSRSSTSSLPSLSLEYKSPNPLPSSPYNASKVALLIENRASPVLAPLMLHFISVVPPDWRFRFLGSVDSVAHMNKSRPIRDAVASGKLDLTYIPANMSTGSQEEISQFLTNVWVYETLLAPAEWLLIFQTDSMLCANSKQSLNNFLEYDWVGAPWQADSKFGGNGGLSLRRVSSIVDVLRNQQRPVGGEAEDAWLSDRLGHRPNAKLANATVSLLFSAEQYSGQAERVVAAKKQGTPDEANNYVHGIDDWRDGFYEPMGYHTGGGGSILPSGIWGTPELRKHIWEYCPEIKMMLQMDAAQYLPGDCLANWKRMESGREGISAESSDDQEYPMLPAGLRPW